jgi:hypothetical protein
VECFNDLLAKERKKTANVWWSVTVVYM